MPKPLRTELPEEILDAASAEFASQGYHAASLDGVARRLGLTKGAVYFHFRSKLELFLKALDRLEARRDAWRRQPAADPLDELRALLRGRLEFQAAHPELRRLHWILDTELRAEPAAAARDGIRADYRALRAELRQLVQQTARSGLVDTGDPAEEAFRLAACLEGTLSQHSASREDVSLYWDVERLVDGWIKPMLPVGRPKGARKTEAQRPAREGEDFQPAF